MTNNTTRSVDIIPPLVQSYLQTLHPPVTPLMRALERYANTRSFPAVGLSSGHWLRLLAQMVSAQRVFEAGSGFGYSAAFFAEAVGPDGQVIGVEKDQWELDAFERIYAGHDLRQRIQLHNGDAVDILETTEGLFDVAFIDVIKSDYLRVLQAVIPRVRIGGLILADNALWGGRVPLDPNSTDESTAAMQAFNQSVHQDPRLQNIILPVGDGLSVSRRVA